MAKALTPTQTRQQHPEFVAHCSFAALKPQLPLRWPALPDLPPSPKRRYRSAYRYLGATDLDEQATWDNHSDFELLLRLVDFSPLRPLLAQLLGWTSAKGQTPFDPVSLLLLCGWQITEKWTRATTLKHLAQPRYAALRRRLGFQAGVYPTEGGVRYFLTALGQHSPDTAAGISLSAYGASPAVDIATQRLNQLLIQAVYLLHAYGFISETAWQQATVCPDGMLHSAASQLRCTAVAETCYQPAPRPCPAREKGRRGCACDTPACAQVCRSAPARDPEARYVWYRGSNGPQPSPNTPQVTTAHSRPRGKGVYGYKSLALRLVDPVYRCSVTLLTDFGPATLTEADHAAALLRQLPTAYPDLHLDAVAGDAAYGYDRPLHIIYHELHARRLIDLRAHDCDRDKPGWISRGYDDRGRPVCAYGYRFTSNGFDPARRRAKWFCAQVCLRPDAQPAVTLPDTVYPPPECPFRDAAHAPYGELCNVGETFPDGTLRLVRDAPVGGTLWKTRYPRARNAVEGRNAVLERWNLKRLPYYGLPRNRALTALADAWDTLTTLVRLCREATAATGG
jgi:hypothetical protein